MRNEEQFELESADLHWADAYHDALHAAAERPASFWTAQRARIREQLSARGKARSARWAFAWAGALCLIGAMLVTGAQFPRSTSQVASTRPSQHALSDQELMADVQATIDNSLPDALAPTDILAQEIDRNLQAVNNAAQK